MLDRRAVHHCPLTGLPVPASVGRGRPAEYVSPEAAGLAHRWQAFMQLLTRLDFTTSANRRMQGMFYVLARAVRQQGAPVVVVDRAHDPVRPTYFSSPAADGWIGCSAAENAAIRYLATCCAGFSDCAQDLKLTRCVITGALIDAGSRNPRRFVSPDAAELDLRLQQVRTLLQQVQFTAPKARAFQGELYSLALRLRKTQNLEAEFTV